MSKENKSKGEDKMENKNGNDESGTGQGRTGQMKDGDDCGVGKASSKRPQPSRK